MAIVESFFARLYLQAALPNSIPLKMCNALNIALGQDRVTDHRISASVIGVERVLNGEYLQTIIEQLVQNEEKERVNLFTAELISKPIKKF